MKAFSNLILAPLLISGCASSTWENEKIQKPTPVQYNAPAQTPIPSQPPQNNPTDDSQKHILSKKIINFSPTYKILPSENDYVFIIDAIIESSEQSYIDRIDADVSHFGFSKKCISSGMRMYCRVGLFSDLNINPFPDTTSRIVVKYSSNIFSEDRIETITINHNLAFKFAHTIRDNIATYRSPNLKESTPKKLSINKLIVVDPQKTDGPFIKVYADKSGYWILSNKITRH